MTPRIGIGIVILLGLLALSQYFLSSPTRSARQVRATSGEVESYYVEDAVLDQRDGDGKQLYRLSAERIEDQPRDQTVMLSKVTLRYPGAEAGSGWDLSADRGEISNDGNQIVLRENVRAQELGGNGMRLIKTSVLNLDVPASVVSTSAEVIVEVQGKRLSAVGMTADLKANTVELQSAVNAHFEP